MHSSALDVHLTCTRRAQGCAQTRGKTACASAREGFHRRAQARRRTAQSGGASAPVEARSGIAFAPRRNMLVARDGIERIALRAGGEQRRERRVLRRLERLSFESFELDADGVVVARLASTPDRAAGMPRAR